MNAFVLVRHGDGPQAFELRELDDPEPGKGEARIAVDTFGLNFADVMASLGLYRDAPPLPAVLGYDVVGRIDKLGNGLKGFREGMRVVAMTRFGGFATEAIATSNGMCEIPDDFDAASATALSTQFVTAWYAAKEMICLHPGDRVLIHAAAGGVGSALVQLAKQSGCTVFGTTGSAWKMKHLEELGVDYPLCTAAEDFERAYRASDGAKPLDVVFDSIGGASVRKGLRMLGSGGRLVSYGVADMMGGAHNLPRSLRTVLSFGFPHPVFLLMRSKSLIGVNMLRIADDRPDIIRRCLREVVARGVKGELKPVVDKVLSSCEFARGFESLRKRETVGKVTVHW
ncbi:MAG TPA: zinc-binding dehydrogenase [Bacteroidota bacterium]|nr:zinc-binding dehydrogenase [Bacteroidota bacterium]